MAGRSDGWCCGHGDDVDSLPPPDVIAAEIVENLQAALEAFQSVADALASTREERDNR